MKKAIVVVGILATLGAVALAQEPVAIVNGEPITREELDRASGLSEIIFTIYQQFPSFAQSLLLTEEGKAFLARYERDVLERLILRKVQVQEARARGLAPDEEEVAARVQSTINRILAYYGLTEDELIEELLAQGMTLEEFREDIARQLTEQLLIEALKAAVTAEVTVTEEEIQDYYTANPARFVDDKGEKLPLVEVRDRIVALLLPGKREAHWQKWLEEARAKAQVTINL